MLDYRVLYFRFQHGLELGASKTVAANRMAYFRSSVRESSQFGIEIR